MTPRDVAFVTMRVYGLDGKPSAAMVSAARAFLDANPELRQESPSFLSRENVGDVYRAFLRNRSAS